MNEIGGILWEACLHAIRTHMDKRGVGDAAPEDPAALMEDVRREALEYLSGQGYSIGKGGSGFLTVCCGCRKVRDGGNRWRSFEDYMAEHSGVEITHGLCAECVKTLHLNTGP
jgi:hypothetical protein